MKEYKKYNMKRLLASALVFALPAIAFAEQRIGNLFQQILNFFAGVVSFLGPVLISLALLAFFWSLIRFLYAKDSTQDSKKYLGYSVLILFVMVSIWGIISFIQSNLGIEGGEQLRQDEIPSVPIPPFRTY